MAFRNILIENPAQLSVRNNQLVIRTDREHTVAIEDISAIMLENRQSVITTAALAQLGQRGCAVYFCDEKHIPCSVLEPFGQNSRGYGVLRQQLQVSPVLIKQLWQQVVQAKIKNQARCLELCGNIDAARGLQAMAERVRSGDSENMEAAAAQRYFRELFGPDFTRNDESDTNAALNYGYAIIRGCVARYLSVYGFAPALGLHHCNMLNSFNLADDCMEPFRPLVDLLVASLPEGEPGLTPQKKRLLFNCLNLQLEVGSKRYAASYAMELTVQSLLRSFKQKEMLLQMPVLLPLEQHRYE